jgi:hypothetical protein
MYNQLNTDRFLAGTALWSRLVKGHTIKEKTVEYTDAILNAVFQIEIPNVRVGFSTTIIPMIVR